MFLTSNTLNNTPFYKVKYNTFDSNYAINGAAIYLDNGNLLMKSNQVMFNRAVVGGSIYLSCYDTVTALNVTTRNITVKATDKDGIPDALLPNPYGEAMKCNI